MNFLPLCTGDGVADHPGTIVERLDQVFTTFFFVARVEALPLFRAGGRRQTALFFSERAILSCLLLYSTQAAPLRPPHFLEAAHRTGDAMHLGQNGQTKRVPCALGMRPQLPTSRACTVLYSTGSVGHDCFTGPHRLLVLTAVRFAPRALRAGWFDGWLRVLVVLFLLSHGFYSHRLHRWRPRYCSSWLPYFLR